MRLCNGPLQSLGLQLHFGNLTRYENLRETPGTRIREIPYRARLLDVTPLTRLIPVVAFLFFIVPVRTVMHAFDTGQNGNALLVVASAQQKTSDLTGTWSGTFISRYPDVSRFTTKSV
jgi:hypothetical protein